MNAIYSGYESIQKYASNRMADLEEVGRRAIKRRLILGASLYPFLYLSNQYLRNIWPSSMQPPFICPPEIAQMNMTQKIVSSLFVITTVPLVGAIEEIAIRELLQGHFLKERISSLLERFPLKAAECWNGTAGKLTRIILLMALFSSLHMLQYASTGTMMTQGLNHAISVLPLGFFSSILPEVDHLGTINAIGLHTINNLVITTFTCYKLLNC